MAMRNLEGQFSDLRASFDGEAQRESVAGLAAGVVVNGKTLFVATHGHSDIATRRKAIDACTLFRIASVTKTFTALSVMHMVASQVVSLDDPVNQHLRTFKVRHRSASTPPVTIRHLLTHQSGLPEPLRRRDVLKPSRLIGPRRGQPVPRLEQLYGSTLVPTQPPGATWAYSNDGYAVLGQLIEDATGVPYTQYVEDNIFRPLGMSQTTYSPQSNDDVACGHRFRRGRIRDVPERVVAKPAAGGAYSSITDMLRFAAALASPGTASFPSQRDLSAMYQAEVFLGDRVPFQGLCFFLDDIGGRQIVLHAGDFPGYESAVFAASRDGIGVVVLCNSSARGAALRLARRLITLTLGVEDPLGSAAAELDPSIARHVVGKYVAGPGLARNVRLLAMTGGRVSVKTTTDALTLRGRFGVLRRRVILLPTSVDDPFRFRFMSRGFPYDGVPVDAVFVPGIDGPASRLDLGLVGARLHRRKGN